MRIENKITLLYGGIFSVTMVLTCIFLFFNAWYVYTESSKTELREVGERIVDYIEAGNTVDKAALDKLRPNQNVLIRVVKITAEGAENEYDTGAPPKMPPEGFGQRPPDTAGQAKLRLFFDGGQYMGHLARAAYGGNRYMIYVFRLNSREHSILATAGVVFIVVNLLGVACSYWMGRYISRLVLKPVARIAKAARHIGAEALHERIVMDGPNDEIMLLANTFNDMIARLEAAFMKQNQFVSDASHELRTPISVIQGYAHLMERWGKDDPAVLREAIDCIQSETAHMSALVEKLLFLAQSDANTQMIPFARVDLAELAREVTREAIVLPEVQDIRWDTQAAGDVWVMGDRDLIKQLMWIFVENSIKYRKKDGQSTIVIRVYKEEGRACFAVEDNGMGMAPEDVGRVFERFYRGDKSRSKQAGGIGLGLSIADSIAKRHGAVVTAWSKPGEGTRMTVSFGTNA